MTSTPTGVGADGEQEQALDRAVAAGRSGAAPGHGSQTENDGSEAARDECRDGDTQSQVGVGGDRNPEKTGQRKGECAAGLRAYSQDTCATFVGVDVHLAASRKSCLFPDIGRILG